MLALVLTASLSCTSGLAGSPGTAASRQQPATRGALDLPFPSPGAFVATTGCGTPAPISAGTSADQQVAVNAAFQQGRPERSYRLHVPRGYDPAKRLPLLLDLHGFGGSAPGEETASGYDALADRFGFAAVYGQGLASPDGAGWASTRPMDLGIDELGYFAAVLDRLQGQLCVDERRIYVTGFSNGGGMAEMLACYMSGRVAAVAPVSGNYYIDSKGTGCHPARPVPLVEIHGTADPTVPYAGIGRVESGGWPLLPVPQFMAGWAGRDGCTNGPTTFLDTPQVTGLRWDGCGGGVGVVHYRWNGGGHGAPAMVGSVPTNEAIWQFLAAYSLPPPG
jgi:polyhydroxybutyrate depolymerase